MSNPSYPNPVPMPMAPPPPQPKKKRTGLIVFLAITAVVLVAIIGGCSAFLASMGKAIDEAGPNDITATTGSDTEAEPADEPGDDSSDKTAKIGDIVKYEDGTEISVREAEIVPAGDYSSASDGNIVIVTVRITNKSAEKFDAALARVNVSYGKDGEQADTGYTDDTDFGFEGDIAPGKSKTAMFGFEITKKQAKDLQITVTPGLFDYGDAIFTGSAS